MKHLAQFSVGTTLKSGSLFGRRQQAELFKSSNKYASQRVYGNLFVDGLPVTYTKDGFDFEDSAFCAQLRMLPQLIDLFAQAEAYRSEKEVTRHFKSEKDYLASLAPKKPAAKTTSKSAAASKGDADKAKSGAKDMDGSARVKVLVASIMQPLAEYVRGAKPLRRPSRAPG